MGEIAFFNVTVRAKVLRKEALEIKYKHFLPQLSSVDGLTPGQFTEANRTCDDSGSGAAAVKAPIRYACARRGIKRNGHNLR